MNVTLGLLNICLIALTIYLICGACDYFLKWHSIFVKEKEQEKHLKHFQNAMDEILTTSQNRIKVNTAKAEDLN